MYFGMQNKDFVNWSQFGVILKFIGFIFFWLFNGVIRSNFCPKSIMGVFTLIPRALFLSMLLFLFF